MDRDVLYGLVGSILFLTVVGAFYLSPSKGRLTETMAVAGAPADMALEPGTSRQYSPEDVRYKFNQKAKKRGKRVVNPVADAPSPVPENTDHEAPPIDDGGDETAEAPPLD